MNENNENKLLGKRKEKERIGNEGEKKTKLRDPVPIPHELSKEE